MLHQIHDDMVFTVQNTTLDGIFIQSNLYLQISSQYQVIRHLGAMTYLFDSPNS